MGNKSYGFSGSLSGDQTIRDVGAGNNKCNLLVANAYAIGAGIGSGGDSGVPVQSTTAGSLLGLANPPAANDWADPSRALGMFSLTSSPGVGDIAAFPHPGGQGHSGLVLGNGLMIYAGPTDVKINTIDDTQRALRAKAVVFREYGQ